MITKVKTKLPGPESKKYIDMSLEYEPQCMNVQAPIVWKSANGVVVEDVDGNTYIDFTSGVLVTNVGHSHPAHVRAIQEQAADLLNCYDFRTVQRVTLAKKLVEISPPHLDKAFLLTSGAEVIEACLRVARRYTGKHEVISFYGAFHGRTYGALSIGGMPGPKRAYGPKLPGTILIPYPNPYRRPFGGTDEECVDRLFEFLDLTVAAESTGDIAAVIVEPYQGTAGFVFPPAGFNKRLEEWAHSRGVLFILDEVQSSFGRTGKMFAMEWEHLTPDLVALGKGIGSGVPTAGMLATSEVLSCLGPGEMSSTTGGNPLSCAAALAVIEILEKEKLPENAMKMGDYILNRFREFQPSCKILGDVRGRGLVMGLEIVKDQQTKEPAPELAAQIVLAGCQNGVLLGKLGFYGNVIRIAPPLVINEKEAAEAVDIICKVLTEHSG